MTRAFSTYKAFSAKRPLLRSSIIAAVALGAILVSAGPAAAQESGNGTFTGVEHAPASTITVPPCAKFTPTSTVPLQEILNMSGTLTAGSGSQRSSGLFTATYTDSTHNYWASPVGTFGSEADCENNTGLGGYQVPGDSMTITGPGTTCTATSSSYERHATSVITIVFTGSCTINGVSSNTTVTFTGTEEACGPLGCPDPSNPSNTVDALLSGHYQQN